MNRKAIILIAVCVLGAGVALLVMTADPASQRGARPQSSWSVTYTPASTIGVVVPTFTYTEPMSNTATGPPTNPPAK